MQLQSLQVFTSQPRATREISLASNFQDLIQEIWEDKQKLHPPQLALPELHVSDALLLDDGDWYKARVGKLVVTPCKAYSGLAYVSEVLGQLV